MPRKPIHLPKRMVVAHAMSQQNTTATTEFSLTDCKAFISNTAVKINIIHFYGRGICIELRVLLPNVQEMIRLH